MDAGIPVIELDRKSVGDPGKDYTAFIGGDNYKIAEAAGQYTATKLLPDGGRSCRARRPAELDPGSRAPERVQGRVKGNPKIQWSPSRRRLAARQGADCFRGDAAGPSRHQDGLCQQRHDGGRARVSPPRAAGKEGQIADHRHRCLRAGGRHPRRCRRRVAATFTYPTGAKEAIDMAKSILLDCASEVPTVVTVDTTAITPENAKSMMGNLRPKEKVPGDGRLSISARHSAISG